MTYKAIGSDIGDLVDQKNRQYGDAINATGEFLRLLYPDGIPVERYDVVGVQVRIFDKLKRIASGHDEDSWTDIAGYGILMEGTK